MAKLLNSILGKYPLKQGVKIKPPPSLSYLFNYSRSILVEDIQSTVMCGHEHLGQVVGEADRQDLLAAVGTTH